MNAKMADLKACFEKMGFTDVRTILSSGNVAFSGRKTQESLLAKTIESGIADNLPRSIPVVLRTTEHLTALLEADPYFAFDISAKAKRVVTFLSQPHEGELLLPIERDDAKIPIIWPQGNVPKPNS